MRTPRVTALIASVLIGGALLAGCGQGTGTDPNGGSAGAGSLGSTSIAVSCRVMRRVRR